MTSSSSIGGIFLWKCAVIFIGVVGIAGNALILYALFASKQHKKHALIVNQNALDLFSSFFLVVNYAMEIRQIRLTGVLGYWLCMMFLTGNLYWIGTNGSMVNFAIITIDRYLKVVYPTRSRKWLRPWVRYSAMAFSWFVGMAYNIPFTFLTSAVIDGVCYGYSFLGSYTQLKWLRVSSTYRSFTSRYSPSSSSATVVFWSPYVARQESWPATIPLYSAPLRPNPSRFKPTWSRR